MKYSVNMLVTCILYCDAGPSCLIRTSCLQVQYVDSYHGYHVCHGTFFFGDAVALLRESESIFLSRVEGRESHVEDGGSRVIYFFLVFAVGSISAAQSNQVCMFLPDLVKCSLT